MSEHEGYHVDVDAVKAWLHKARYRQDQLMIVGQDNVLDIVQSLVMEVDQLRSDRAALTERPVAQETALWRANATAWRELYGKATSDAAIGHGLETLHVEAEYRTLSDARDDRVRLPPREREPLVSIDRDVVISQHPEVMPEGVDFVRDESGAPVGLTSEHGLPFPDEATTDWVRRDGGEAPS